MKWNSLVILTYLISASLLAAADCIAQERSAPRKQLEIQVLSAVGMREVLKHLGRNLKEPPDITSRSSTTAGP
jgi:hypothetical protein